MTAPIEIKSQYRISIFDLDGTLIDHDWRLPMIVPKDGRPYAEGKNRFSVYHDNIVNDCNSIAAGRIALDIAMKDKDVLYFSTARPESHRRQTESQLREFFGLTPSDYFMYMRQPEEEGMASPMLKDGHMRQIEKREQGQGAAPGMVSSVEFYDDHLGTVTRLLGASVLGCKVTPYWVSKVGLFRGSIAKSLIESSGGIDNNSAKVTAAVNLHPVGALVGILCGRAHEQCRPFPNGVDGTTSYNLVMSASWVDVEFHRVDLTHEVWHALAGAYHALGAPAVANYDFAYARGGRAKENGKMSRAPTTHHQVALDQGVLSLAEVAELTMRTDLPENSAADVLENMAALYRERNAGYKDNAVVVARVMKVLFPNGVDLKTEEDYHFWHLFELMIVKLTRFTNSGLRHEDSIRDLAVYAAMTVPLIDKHNIAIKE